MQKNKKAPFKRAGLREISERVEISIRQDGETYELAPKSQAGHLGKIVVSDILSKRSHQS
jgi:hypothetical protein